MATDFPPRSRADEAWAAKQTQFSLLDAALLVCEFGRFDRASLQSASLAAHGTPPQKIPVRDIPLNVRDVVEALADFTGWPEPNQEGLNTATLRFCHPSTDENARITRDELLRWLNVPENRVYREMAAFLMPTNNQQSTAGQKTPSRRGDKEEPTDRAAPTLERIIGGLARLLVKEAPERYGFKESQEINENQIANDLLLFFQDADGETPRGLRDSNIRGRLSAALKAVKDFPKEDFSKE